MSNWDRLKQQLGIRTFTMKRIRTRKKDDGDPTRDGPSNKKKRRLNPKRRKKERMLHMKEGCNHTAGGPGSDAAAKKTSREQPTSNQSKCKPKNRLSSKRRRKEFQRRVEEGRRLALGLLDEKNKEVNGQRGLKKAAAYGSQEKKLQSSKKKKKKSAKKKKRKQKKGKKRKLAEHESFTMQPKKKAKVAEQEQQWKMEKARPEVEVAPKVSEPIDGALRRKNPLRARRKSSLLKPNAQPFEILSVTTKTREGTTTVVVGVGDQPAAATGSVTWGKEGTPPPCREDTTDAVIKKKNKATSGEEGGSTSSEDEEIAPPQKPPGAVRTPKARPANSDSDSDTSDGVSSDAEVTANNDSDSDSDDTSEETVAKKKWTRDQAGGKRSDSALKSQRVEREDADLDALISLVKNGGQKVVHEATGEKTKEVAMDCEFVGVGSDSTRNALARVSIVNFYGDVLIDTFVRPTERVTDFRTHVSGVHPKALRTAMPFFQAQAEVAKILSKDTILVGHSLKNDMKALLMKHPKERIKDTSTFKLLCPGGRPRALRQLVKDHLGLTIQAKAHSSVEDARATLALYRKYKTEWRRQEIVERVCRLPKRKVQQFRKRKKKKRS